MKNTQIKVKQLIILSDGSSFKNILSSTEVKLKKKDFKQVLLKSKKKLLSSNKVKLNEIIYRKLLFT